MFLMNTFLNTNTLIPASISVAFIDFFFFFGCCSFSEEEISNMRKELEKYGIQMPSFSKIGGILANELSVDEAARESA